MNQLQFSQLWIKIALARRAWMGIGAAAAILGRVSAFIIPATSAGLLDAADHEVALARITTV